MVLCFGVCRLPFFFANIVVEPRHGVALQHKTYNNRFSPVLFVFPFHGLGGGNGFNCPEIDLRFFPIFICFSVNLFLGRDTEKD